MSLEILECTGTLAFDVAHMTGNKPVWGCISTRINISEIKYIATHVGLT